MSAQQQLSSDAFSVLTLNCWGLPDLISGAVYSAYSSSLSRAQRLEAIANKLVRRRYDVVALQELWMGEDKKTVERVCQESYPHIRHFESGLSLLKPVFCGGGLPLLSRWPMEVTRFHRFSMRGKPQRLQHGDHQAGKGVRFARVLAPSGPVHVCVDIDCRVFVWCDKLFVDTPWQIHDALDCRIRK